MLHLIKLCVGADSIADLERWIGFRLRQKASQGLAPEQVHTTRMTPRRVSELLDGGSLYWVIKGTIQCRQQLNDIRPFVDEEGIGRCHLVLEPVVEPVVPRPRGPFQGWRYLDSTDAPPDLKTGEGGDLPQELQQELASLGLL
ncbi:MAG: DUF1489 family protein [Flavobacteriaceae bacterium]